MNGPILWLPQSCKEPYAPRGSFHQEVNEDFTAGNSEILENGGWWWRFNLLLMAIYCSIQPHAEQWEEKKYRRVLAALNTQPGCTVQTDSDAQICVRSATCMVNWEKNRQGTALPEICKVYLSISQMLPASKHIHVLQKKKNSSAAHELHGYIIYEYMTASVPSWPLQLGNKPTKQKTCQLSSQRMWRGFQLL